MSTVDNSITTNKYSCITDCHTKQHDTSTTIEHSELAELWQPILAFKHNQAYKTRFNMVVSLLRRTRFTRISLGTVYQLNCVCRHCPRPVTEIACGDLCHDMLCLPWFVH